jgi:hypothetical protein
LKPQRLNYQLTGVCRAMEVLLPVSCFRKTAFQPSDVAKLAYVIEQVNTHIGFLNQIFTLEKMLSGWGFPFIIVDNAKGQIWSGSKKGDVLLRKYFPEVDSVARPNLLLGKLRDICDGLRKKAQAKTGGQETLSDITSGDQTLQIVWSLQETVQVLLLVEEDSRLTLLMKDFPELNEEERQLVHYTVSGYAAIDMLAG